MTRARETSENARQAKAWVNFDGTFGSSPFTLANGGIRSAFNVSSITDFSTGVYLVSFTEPFEDTSFCSMATSCRDVTLVPNNMTVVRAISAATTRANVYVTTGSSDGWVDAEEVYYCAFH